MTIDWDFTRRRRRRRRNPRQEAIYQLKRRIGPATKNLLTLPFILRNFEFLQDSHFVASNGYLVGSNIEAYGNRVNTSQVEQILLEANTASAHFPKVSCKVDSMSLGIAIGAMIFGLILANIINILGLLFLIGGLIGICYSLSKSINDMKKKNRENNQKRATAVRGVLDRLNCSTFYNSDFTTTVDSRGEYIRIDVSYTMAQSLT